MNSSGLCHCLPGDGNPTMMIVDEAAAPRTPTGPEPSSAEGRVDQPAAAGFPRCRALAVSCIDFRFVEPLRQLLHSQGLAGDYDLVCWPGGALALTTADQPVLLDALALACELHQPTELYLIAHHDCGRVGGSASFAGRHAEIATLDTGLAMAAEATRERFPQLQVRLARLDLDRPRAVINSLAQGAAQLHVDGS